MAFSIRPLLSGLFIFLYLVPLTAYALKILQPTQKGSTTIFDDTEPTLITWTATSGDPSQFDIRLQNDATGMAPYLLEYQLQTEWGSYNTWIPPVQAEHVFFFGLYPPLLTFLPSANYYIACYYYRDDGPAISCPGTDKFAIHKKGTKVTESPTSNTSKTTVTTPSAPPHTTTQPPNTTPSTTNNGVPNSTSVPNTSLPSSSSGSTGPTTVTTTSDGTIIVYTSSPTPTSPSTDTSSGGNTSTGSTSKHSSTGPIVGGVVGGVAIVILIAILIWLLRRRRRHVDLDETEMEAQAPLASEVDQTHSTISLAGRTATRPVVTPFTRQPAVPSEKQRQLDRIVQERQEALQRRERLQDGLSSTGGTNMSTAGSTQDELHEKIAQLTARIFELETQQRETEQYIGRASHFIPPPDYDTSTLNRT